MEQYSRILKLIDNNTLSCIQEKSVVIVGIGGVGGYALEMLCRFGLKKITIIDADVVDISNLNRHVPGKDIVLSRSNRTELKNQYQQFLFRLARRGEI